METYHQKFWPMNWRKQELPELKPEAPPALAVSASETSVLMDQTTVRLRRRIEVLERQRDDLMDCMKSLQSCVEGDRGLWLMLDRVIRAFEEELK